MAAMLLSDPLSQAPVRRAANDGQVDYAALLPQPASLADPLYYLKNGQSVLRFVLMLHTDLLTADEITLLNAFLRAPTGCQALLFRMVMRKGIYFRSDKLKYAEIGSLPLMAAQLIDMGLLQPDAALTLSEFCQLISAGELDTVFKTQLQLAGKLRCSKAEKIAYLQSLSEYQLAQPFLDWWPAAACHVWALTQMPLFDRIRLMFFGNLHQDWSEFVLTELGNQRYETVTLNSQSRAFQSRAEVDEYLALHVCREQLAQQQPVASIYAALPQAETDNPWLAARRAKLLYQLAYAAEKTEPQLAMSLYQQCGYHEAPARYLRMLERSGNTDMAYQQVTLLLQSYITDSQKQSLWRLYRRLHKKHGSSDNTLRAPFIDKAAIGSQSLTLRYQQRVEQAVIEALYTEQQPVFYVENTLFCGLFALLCWPAIYAPVRGAFFHPFHAGPADLLRPDFARPRQQLFEQCLASLNDNSYATRILNTYQVKHGISCPLINWSVLTPQLLHLALTCIAAADLQLIFTRLLADIRYHSSGFPDLIQFYPSEQCYRLIEVKGPGDTLQDNQIRWLDFFNTHHIDASVCYVKRSTDA